MDKKVSIETSDDELWKESQALNYMHISKSTLRKWRTERHFPSIKIGRTRRYTKSAIDQWLSGYEVVGYKKEEEAWQESKKKTSSKQQRGKEGKVRSSFGRIAAVG